MSRKREIHERTRAEEIDENGRVDDDNYWQTLASRRKNAKKGGIKKSGPSGKDKGTCRTKAVSMPSNGCLNTGRPRKDIRWIKMTWRG